MGVEVEDIGVGVGRTLATDAGSRACATVDGEALFFESEDLELVAPPELFASALLPYAVSMSARLVLESPPDGVWLRNVERLLAIWSGWWGTPAELQRVLALPGPPESPGPDARHDRGVGLCFTLGVDSFYSLLRSDRRPDRLLFAEGYDLPLGDEPRVEAIRAALADVESELGVPAAIVRTNLRDHPIARPRQALWHRTHGGALAALGHAAGGSIAELLISSTKPYFANRPWGSHWETDPCWSSSRLRVTHMGAEVRRNEKLATMLDEPLVRRHLRVCWENRSASGNCCECEKCVRTMLILSGHGRLSAFEAFPERGSLIDRVEALPPLIPDLLPVYRAAAAPLAEGPLRSAVARLVQRSLPPRLPLVRRAISHLAGRPGR